MGREGERENKGEREGRGEKDSARAARAMFRSEWFFCEGFLPLPAQSI